MFGWWDEPSAREALYRRSNCCGGVDREARKREPDQNRHASLLGTTAPAWS